METPTALKLDITLPRLTGTELAGLIEWAGAKGEKFPYFSRWLLEACVAELERRQTGGEPGMAELPLMTGSQWADFLLGAFLFARGVPLSEAQAKFIDDLNLKVAGHLAGILDQHNAEIYG